MSTPLTALSDGGLDEAGRERIVELELAMRKTSIVVVTLYR